MAIRPLRGIHPDGLRIQQRRVAGGRIARVADGQFAGQFRQHVVGEDVGDQAHALDVVKVGVVGGGDAGGLLPAMLQRVQREIGLARRVGMAVNRHHSTLFAQLVNLVQLVACDECVLSMPLVSYRADRCAAALPARSDQTLRRPDDLLPDQHPAVDRELKEISHGFTQRGHHQARILLNDAFDLRHRFLGTADHSTGWQFRQTDPIPPADQEPWKDCAHSDSMSRSEPSAKATAMPPSETSRAEWISPALRKLGQADDAALASISRSRRAACPTSAESTFLAYSEEPNSCMRSSSGGTDRGSDQQNRVAGLR